MNEYPELKSYKRKDVDEFLLQLNAAHLRVVTEKDDEIKRLYSECEYLKRECNQREGEIQRLKDEYESKLAEKQRESDSVNARLGEKLSVAENAASSIIAEAKAEKEKIMALAKGEADSYIAQARAKADEYCEKARQLSGICREHQQKALQSLDIMNKQLDIAVEEMTKLLSGGGI